MDLEEQEFFEKFAQSTEHNKHLEAIQIIHFHEWAKVLLDKNAKKNASPYCTCRTPYPDTFGEKCKICYKELG